MEELAAERLAAIATLEAQIAELSSQRDERVMELEAQLQSFDVMADERVAQLQLQLDAFDEQKDARIIVLESEIEQLNANIASQSDIISETTDNLQQARSQLQQMELSGSTATQQLTNAQTSYNRLLSVYDTDVASLNAEIGDLEARKAALEADLQALQVSSATVEQQLTVTRSRLADTESELTATQDQLADTQFELAATQDTLASTQSALDDTQSAMDEQNAAFASTQADTFEAKALLQQDFTEQLSAVQTQYDADVIALNAEIGDLEARRAALQTELETVQLSADQELENRTFQIQSLQADFSAKSSDQEALMGRQNRLASQNCKPRRPNKRPLLKSWKHNVPALRNKWRSKTRRSQSCRPLLICKFLQLQNCARVAAILISLARRCPHRSAPWSRSWQLR